VTAFPSVSIVMPVRNESDHIGAALDAALNQDYQGELEVVVAEGASTDETRAVVERRAAADSRVRIVDNPGGHTAAGLNRAIETSVAAIVVRCDGHSELAPDYVSAAVEVLTKTGAANVGGIQAAEGKTFVQRAIALAMTSPLGVGNSRFHYSTTAGPADTVYLGVFDRKTLAAVGGFDESLKRNQDYELNHRLRSRGHLVWFDPGLRVTYRPRSNLVALWRQYFEYSSWKRKMLRATPGAIKTRQLAPPLLVLALIASAALLAAGSPLAVAVPGVYVGFLVIGSLVEVVRRRAAEALILPFVLAVMHVGWGLGFLVGRARPL
jgi:succinoglycan biosynthesis protein ExoA